MNFSDDRMAVIINNNILALVINETDIKKYQNVFQSKIWHWYFWNLKI